MNKFIVAMLALATAALASPVFAVATWEHFNADPAYQSREAAITDAPRVLRQVGYPEPVVLLLIEAMKKPGTRTHVTNGMKFDFMRSGKSALWRNVVVKFEKPPRQDSMEYSAPAEEWTVDQDGALWTAGIPDVCNNLYGKRPVASSISTPSGRKTPPPQPAVPVARGPVLGCPNIWVLEVANWENKAFYLPGVEQTHAKEKFGVKFVGRAHVSRTHGPQFRAAYDKGDIVHSKVSSNFRVSLIMTPEARNGDTTITEEKFYKDIVVVGSREVEFTRADLDKWDAIRVVAAVGEEVRSPPRFAETGFHEMRFFRDEWANPVQRPCFKTEHWIEQPQIEQKQ